MENKSFEASNFNFSLFKATPCVRQLSAALCKQFWTAGGRGSAPEMAVLKRSLLSDFTPRAERNSLKHSVI